MYSSENRHCTYRRRCNTSPDIIEGFEIQRRLLSRQEYIQSRDRSIRNYRHENRTVDFGDRSLHGDRARQQERGRFNDRSNGRLNQGRFVRYRSEVQEAHIHRNDEYRRESVPNSGRSGRQSHGLLDHFPRSHGLLDDIPQSHGLLDRNPRSHGLLDSFTQSHGLLDRAPRSHGLLDDIPQSHGLSDRNPRSHGLLDDFTQSHGLLDRAPRSHGLLDGINQSRELSDHGQQSRGQQSHGLLDRGQPERSQSERSQPGASERQSRPTKRTRPNAPADDPRRVSSESEQQSSSSSVLKSLPKKSLNHSPDIIVNSAALAKSKLKTVTPIRSASSSTKETKETKEKSDEKSTKKRGKKSKKQKKKAKKAKKKSSKSPKSSKKSSGESEEPSTSTANGSLLSEPPPAVAGPSGLGRVDLPDDSDDEGESQNVGTEADMEAMRNRMAPMTKEQWDRQQNTIRREVSPTTGRVRLIRGTGEVIEEIVTRDRHKKINVSATIADGQSFQETVMNQVNQNQN